MDVTTERESGVLYCLLKGRVDGDSAEQLYETVSGEVTPDDAALVADLSEVPFVSSAGLRSFVQLARASDSQGVKFSVCGMSQGVNEVFEMTGLNRIMPIFANRNEAKEAIAQGNG
jgi:anti-anti-sigma factor